MLSTMQLSSQSLHNLTQNFKSLNGEEGMGYAPSAPTMDPPLVINTAFEVFTCFWCPLLFNFLCHLSEFNKIYRQFFSNTGIPYRRHLEISRFEVANVLF